MRVLEASRTAKVTVPAKTSEPDDTDACRTMGCAASLYATVVSNAVVDVGPPGLNVATTLASDPAGSWQSPDSVTVHAALQPTKIEPPSGSAVSRGAVPGSNAR